MLETIKNIKNHLPFYYFEQISKIPRASGNERGMVEYIKNIAIENGLEYYTDKGDNILVRKKGSVGRENEDTIMLQAHTDMVAEKNNNTVHDFASDPIMLIQDGNILRANGTTLGADDGFGVAIMLAVLTDKSLSTPPIECLFTASEEIGLVGAGKFDYSKINAKRMINLDSAEENTVIIGCCGGVRTEMTIPVDCISESTNGVKITIGGLCGGHSGEDIDKGRKNANVVMGSILGEINKKISLCISSISGGDKDNAIPRECTAIFATESKEKSRECISLIEEVVADIKRDLVDEDKSFLVVLEEVSCSYHYSKESTEKILKVLSLPNAVLEYRKVKPILPQTSRNLAKIRSYPDGKITIGFSSRSYLEEKLDWSCAELDKIAREIGASTYHHERYPGWQGEGDSALVVDWQSAYERATGRRTEPTLIHAGLECGLITSKVNGLEAISVGANVHDLHTPQETMEIDSFDRIYDTVVELLKK
ncbi:MAG: beta-Ala-His dipeptidase [Clostridia bacterium]|nr:beta-Ala-His dipeptidase [Clostridia bacterium]